ncbi:BnaC01g38330D [Brassica napus]|uniref:BnaC01g38330D protein n=1 Tax=Brassica napus TaxID=3708 RepID=A0A078IMT8_BRANA|nr:BnaC01g38330D [Brassica napus]
MDTKTIFMTFFIINTLVSCAYPCLGQENVDDKPLVNPGEFDTLDALSPASQEYNIYMLENLPPKYKTYLGTCADKMGPSGISECNEDVLREILTNKPVSRECCLMVVRAGKECYMEIRKFMFRLYQLKRLASQVSFKTIELGPNMKIPDNGFSEQDVVDTSGDNGGSRSYGDGQLVSEEIDGVLLVSVITCDSYYSPRVYVLSCTRTLNVFTV